MMPRVPLPQQDDAGAERTARRETLRLIQGAEARQAQKKVAGELLAMVVNRLQFLAMLASIT